MHASLHARMHIHTHTHIYTYIYMCVCVRAYVLCAKSDFVQVIPNRNIAYAYKDIYVCMCVYVCIYNIYVTRC